VEPALAPVKVLESPPIVLPDETPAKYVPSDALAQAEDLDRPHLSLRAQAAVDAGRPDGITIEVTLRNDGKRPVTLRFRPESLRFTVSGPAGVEDCIWPTRPVAAMRELYSTVRPGGADTLGVLLSDYCSDRSLGTPGLLLVTPYLDTRKASGDSIGIRSFDGEVAATRPTVVRLHEGRSQPRLVRPQLEAQ
jgi:hypothetical protein